MLPKNRSVTRDVSSLSLNFTRRKVLVLGRSPFSIRSFVSKFRVIVRRVYLIHDLATEFEVETHYADGWAKYSTFFAEDATAGSWDFVVIQGSNTEPNEIGQSAAEILELLTIPVQAREVLIVQTDDEPAQESLQSALCPIAITPCGLHG
jgi:hypothetical protein